MYKIFSHLPTGIYQWDDVSNGSDDWAGRKYELPSGYRIHHNQRDRNYVYAVVSLAADSHFIGGPIVTYIFSRVMVRSSVVVYTVYTSSD